MNPNQRIGSAGDFGRLQSERPGAHAPEHAIIVSTQQCFAQMGLEESSLLPATYKSLEQLLCKNTTTYWAILLLHSKNASRSCRSSWDVVRSRVQGGLGVS
ncbi:hypothetical protein AG1IA_05443 [Rhizoctonia solani AG-1 IA]|uniref:Uncharacterized protein n=1 Tax=Thanatephorus cucumeris (strain AG1-IA) TaxID=983506 RepID=L8WQW8_THACA|nr:hypothetical protein AG1IA_05443 [Rhizoctonia solani AG-1 IA]